MKCKNFLDFLPDNFRHEKSFFKNNQVSFETLSNLSDLDINEIQRKSCKIPGKSKKINENPRKSTKIRWESMKIKKNPKKIIENQ